MVGSTLVVSGCEFRSSGDQAGIMRAFIDVFKHDSVNHHSVVLLVHGRKIGKAIQSLCKSAAMMGSIIVMSIMICKTRLVPYLRGATGQRFMFVMVMRERSTC